MKSLMIKIDSYFIRIRTCIWKAWKRISKRFSALNS